MEKENNAGYTITDRLTVGNTEFVIGQNDNAPAKFVTWKCNKGKTDYHWGHYCSERMTALEDLCKRALDEIHYLRSLQQGKDTGEKPVGQSGKKRQEPER